MFEALEASKKLEPYGWTISKAVDHVLANVIKFQDKPTLAVLVRKFMADSERIGDKAETTADLRYRMKKLVAALGSRRLNDISSDDIKALDEGMQTTDKLSPVSRNQFLTRWSSFFGWAIANRLTDYNPCNPKAVRRSKIIRKAPKFYTVEQCKSILEVAQEGGFYFYCCLGLFAGIRPDELKRLSMADISLENRTIRVLPKVQEGLSKHRIVEFPANDVFGDCLFDWLSARPLPKKVWHTNKSNYKIHFRAFRKALEARGVEWIQDGMRHSAGTYYFAQYESLDKAMKLLAHNNPATFYNHYRGLATRRESAEFYSLRPKKV